MAEKPMVEKVVEFLVSAGILPKPRPPFDPAVFGDPLAKATQWTPLQGGGASFCTHRLKKIDSMAMEFKTTVGMQLFCFVFILMGAAFAVGPAAAIYRQYGGFHWSILPAPLFGLFFFAIGVFMYYYTNRPIVFDLKRNCFYKGKILLPSPSQPKGVISVELHRVRAIQVLSEYCSGSKSSFYSYELNLVLDDASRVNVVDHGGLKSLRDDAGILSRFLGVPVWDIYATTSGENNMSSDPLPQLRG